MVAFTRTPDTVIDDTEQKRLSKNEQQRLQELWRQDILQHVFMNPDMSKVWIVMKGKERGDIEEVVDSLPYCQHLDFDIHPLIE
jgi:muconolactone delta-isomerase